jgi:hypothetical protein
MGFDAVIAIFGSRAVDIYLNGESHSALHRDETAPPACDATIGVAGIECGDPRLDRRH